VSEPLQGMPTKATWCDRKTPDIWEIFEGLAILEMS